jgi:hypothetical protein
MSCSWIMQFMSSRSSRSCYRKESVPFLLGFRVYIVRQRTKEMSCNVFEENYIILLCSGDRRKKRMEEVGRKRRWEEWKGKDINEKHPLKLLVTNWNSYRWTKINWNSWGENAIIFSFFTNLDITIAGKWVYTIHKPKVKENIFVPNKLISISFS